MFSQFLEGAKLLLFLEKSLWNFFPQELNEIDTGKKVV